MVNVYGTKDNLIPPSSSLPLTNAVGSRDKEEASFKVGHAGIVASSTSQKEVAPKIVDKQHCKKERISNGLFSGLGLCVAARGNHSPVSDCRPKTSP